MVSKINHTTFGGIFHEGGGGTAIPPELVRFLKNVPNGLIHPEMKRKIFPHYRPPLPYLALVTGFSIPALLM